MHRSMRPLGFQPQIIRYSQQGGCCLEDIGDGKSAELVQPRTPVSTCASRMRSILLLLEGLLEILVETDENAVVWEPKVRRPVSNSSDIGSP